MASHLSAVDWDGLVGFDPRLTGYLFCCFIFEQVQLLSKRGTLETTEASLGIFEENSKKIRSNDISSADFIFRFDVFEFFYQIE